MLGVLLDWLAGAADRSERCPTNDAIAGRFDIGLATAAGLVKALETRGLIRVVRYQCARVVTIVATGRSTAAPRRGPIHWRDRDQGLAGPLRGSRQARQRRVTEHPPAEILGRVPSVIVADELAARPALPSPLTMALVEAGAAEIGDAVAMVRRRWPVLWRRVCAAARAREELPGAVLVEAVEAGLAVLLGEVGHIEIGEGAHAQ